MCKFDKAGIVVCAFKHTSGPKIVVCGVFFQMLEVLLKTEVHSNAGTLMSLIFH